MEFARIGDLEEGGPSMPRKQRFKPSRKPKPDPTTVEPTNSQQTSAVGEPQATRNEELESAAIEQVSSEDQRA